MTSHRAIPSHRAMTTRRSRSSAALAALLLVALTACGDDGSAAAPPTVSAPGESAGEPADEHADDAATVVIEGVDYAFRDVPGSVPAGTRLAFRNSARAELHELVAFRVADDAPALEELVALPADELLPVLGPPATVMLQAPGSDELIVAVGDGVLREPGRYVLMCFIPTGADPAEYLAAAAASGGEAPTGIAGGPPHFAGGMYAELVVEP